MNDSNDKPAENQTNATSGTAQDAVVDAVSREMTGFSQRLSAVEMLLSRHTDIFENLADVPPPMSDAQKIANEFTVLRGEINGISNHLNSLDGFADIAASINARLSIVEQHGGIVPPALQRDMAHETQTVVREFKCTSCGATSTDTVSTAVVNATERPCPICSGTAVIVATHLTAADKVISDANAASLKLA